MKILLIPNASYSHWQYNWLIEKGHEVFFMDGSQNPDCMTKEGGFTGIRNFIKNPQTTIIQAIESVQPDYIYAEACSGSLWFPQAFCKEIKEAFPKVKLILWIGDASVILGQDFTEPYLEGAKWSDYSYFVDETIVEKAISKGYNAKWIRQCGISDCFKPLGLEKIYDCCFVGGSYGKIKPDGSSDISRVQMLKEITDKMPELKCCFVGDKRYSIYGENYGGESTMGPNPDDWSINCNVIYNQSKIVLCNDVSDCNKFMSVRTANALLSGSMVMARYNEEYEDIFIDDYNIVLFRSIEQLRELLGFYLGHDYLIEEVGQEGRELALRDGFTREGHMQTIFGEL